MVRLFFMFALVIISCRVNAQNQIAPYATADTSVSAPAVQPKIAASSVDGAGVSTSTVQPRLAAESQDNPVKKDEEQPIIVDPKDNY